MHRDCKNTGALSTAARGDRFLGGGCPGNISWAVAIAGGAIPLSGMPGFANLPAMRTCGRQET